MTATEHDYISLCVIDMQKLIDGSGGFDAFGNISVKWGGTSAA